MAVLLIAEHNNKDLKAFTLNAATAASQMDEDVHAIIIGHNSGDVSKKLSELPVIKKVISIDAPHYENFTAENFAPVITKVAENYSHIVCSANTFGKNLMPRIAAHLENVEKSFVPINFFAPFFIIPRLSFLIMCQHLLFFNTEPDLRFKITYLYTLAFAEYRA